MKAVKANIPRSSLVQGFLPADYADAFVYAAEGSVDFSADDVQSVFWTDMPRWIVGMMKLRDLMVKPFGLRGSKGVDAAELKKCIRRGGNHGMFSVVEKSGNEAVVMLQDSHLKAWMSVMIDASGIYAITLVKYNNRLGRAYFFVIGPFHKIIVRSALASAVRKLSQKRKETNVSE